MSESPKWRILFMALALVLFLFPAVVMADPSLCTAVSGNKVANCGFEGGTTTPGGNVPNDWSTAQWTSFEAVVTTPVNSGTYALRIANDEYQPGEPLYNGAAILSQTLTDTPGTYTFSFYLENGDSSGWNGGTGSASNMLFQAYWDRTLLESVYSGASVYSPYTFTVTGTGADTIMFTSYNTPSYYYLDDVVVTGGSAPIPEPGSFLLFGTGLLAMGGIVRRRFAHKIRFLA